MAARFADATFVKVDTEQTPANAELAQQAGISSYPTFHYYIGGTKVHEASGANATAIENAVRKYSAQAAAAPAGGGSAGAGSSGSAASAAGAGAGALTQRVMAALSALRGAVSEEDFRVAVRTLLTFVRNIADNPTDPKYRKVRTGNSAYQTRIARHGSLGTACMLAFGFEALTENGESTLVITAAAANNPELRVVKSQLEAAMGMGPGVAAAPAAPAATPPAAAAPGGFGGMPGLGAMGGMGGMGGDPAARAAEMMQDPEMMK